MTGDEIAASSVVYGKGHARRYRRASARRLSRRHTAAPREGHGLSDRRGSSPLAELPRGAINAPVADERWTTRIRP